MITQSWCLDEVSSTAIWGFMSFTESHASSSSKIIINRQHTPHSCSPELKQPPFGLSSSITRPHTASSLGSVPRLCLLHNTPIHTSMGVVQNASPGGKAPPSFMSRSRHFFPWLYTAGVPRTQENCLFLAALTSCFSSVETGKKQR